MSRASWIEETTSSIAGTNGDGAVTLVAIANVPRASSVWGTGARIVDYTIEKFSNGFMEEGIGTVAGNVLTRTRPRATWNGTTYDDTSPDALQFGASPTLGDVKVRLAPQANEFIPAPRSIQTTVGSDVYLGYQLPGQTTSSGNPQTGETLSVTTEYYMPYLCLTRGHIDGFMTDVAVAAAGVNLKPALYEVGHTGLPGPCITQFNSISVGTTGRKFDTVPGTWAVNPGPLRVSIDWYYLGWMVSGGGSALLNFGSSENTFYPPTSRRGGYGFGQLMSKVAENSFATGMPSGTPTGTYTLLSSNVHVLGLRINN